MKKSSEAIQTTYLSMLSSAGLAILKAVVGVTGNSYAMIADAIESLTDIFASIIVLIGLKVASKPADKGHPYGHGKAEALATFAVAAIMIVSATLIGSQSIENINTPHDLPKSFTLYVLGAIIIFKELSFQYVNRKSKQANSSALKADAWHHRSDAITSLSAFIGISIALILGKGYETADDWAALLASGVIFYNSYLILKPALGEIMDEHHYDDMIALIRKKAKEVNGILDTEKCLVRKTGMQYYVDLHITVNAFISVKDGHEIAHRLKDHLIAELPEIADVLIHVEPEEEK
ncbi:MAG TPA: cation diffusion facilitator family transporter [Cytophagaceae bacterium]|jgi:cation diffusion facilitator family transporter|nr:cation diffusion facilitator family transporter [Cytophagaceae bacterium]